MSLDYEAIKRTYNNLCLLFLIHALGSSGILSGIAIFYPLISRHGSLGCANFYNFILRCHASCMISSDLVVGRVRTVAPSASLESARVSEQEADGDIQDKHAEVRDCFDTRGGWEGSQGSW